MASLSSWSTHWSVRKNSVLLCCSPEWQSLDSIQHSVQRKPEGEHVPSGQGYSGKRGRSVQIRVPLGSTSQRQKDGFVSTQLKTQEKRGAIYSFQSPWGEYFNAILILTEVKLWNAPHRLMCSQHFVPSLWQCFEGCGPLGGRAWLGRWVKVCPGSLCGAESSGHVPQLPRPEFLHTKLSPLR